MDNISKVKSWYRIIDTKFIGNTLAHRLIQDLGDPVEYVGRKNSCWEKIAYINQDLKYSLQEDKDPPYWNKIINFLENHPDFKFVTFLDDKYPEQLKNIYQPPLFITCFGDLSLLKHPDIISIVGTRKPTPYGRYITDKIVSSLVSNNYYICSGLALGIDSCAHKKTLESQGKTIAVLACGLDIVYPPQNRQMANTIKESGLIISENLPCTPFEKFHFPQRNRIISALSKAVCVIEGKVQSGAMITAKFAIEQNKEVYALPGDILKPEAQGPNFLIQKGAKIILTPDDITNDFNIDYKTKENIVKKPDLTDEEKTIYDIIKIYPPDIHIDQLIVETGLTIGKVSEILFMLELKNAIRSTESGKYSICL